MAVEVAATATATFTYDRHRFTLYPLILMDQAYVQCLQRGRKGEGKGKKVDKLLQTAVGEREQ